MLLLSKEELYSRSGLCEVMDAIRFKCNELVFLCVHSCMSPPVAHVALKMNWDDG